MTMKSYCWPLLLIIFGCIPLAHADHDDDMEDNNPCIESGTYSLCTWECEAQGSISDASLEGDTEFEICIGSSISAPTADATLTLGSKNCDNGVNTLICPESPYFGANPNRSSEEVSYTLSEIRWEPELPGTFEDAGEFTFTAYVKGISGDDACEDTVEVSAGVITVTVIADKGNCEEVDYLDEVKEDYEAVKEWLGTYDILGIVPTAEINDLEATAEVCDCCLDSVLITEGYVEGTVGGSVDFEGNISPLGRRIKIKRINNSWFSLRGKVRIGLIIDLEGSVPLSGTISRECNEELCIEIASGPPGNLGTLSASVGGEYDVLYRIKRGPWATPDEISKTGTWIPVTAAGDVRGEYAVDSCGENTASLCWERIELEADFNVTIPVVGNIPIYKYSNEWAGNCP